MDPSILGLISGSPPGGRILSIRIWVKIETNLKHLLILEYLVVFLFEPLIVARGNAVGALHIAPVSN